MVVIADIGDALFGSADLVMSRRTEFISPAYYTSMGFGVPAAVGAGIANRESRPLVVVGDGAFQMTGMELSTVVRQKLNPIVIVMNNKGYTTERFLLEGSFNDIQNWAYHKVPEVVGGGLGLEVRTLGELDEALARALANTEELQPAERPPRPARPEPGPGSAGSEALGPRPPDAGMTHGQRRAGGEPGFASVRRPRCSSGRGRVGRSRDVRPLDLDVSLEGPLGEPRVLLRLVDVVVDVAGEVLVAEQPASAGTMFSLDGWKNSWLRKANPLVGRNCRWAMRGRSGL